MRKDEEMNSKKLNKAIAALDEIESLPSVEKDEKIYTGESIPIGEDSLTVSSPGGAATLSSLLGINSDTGKKIFYWGWYWREVDFDSQISLAWDEEGTTGFCENNKWGYPESTLTKEKSEELHRLCEQAVTLKTEEAVAAVNQFMSDCKPAFWKESAIDAREEVDRVMREFRSTSRIVR